MTQVLSDDGCVFVLALEVMKLVCGDGCMLECRSRAANTTATISTSVLLVITCYLHCYS